jgi:hypothetical protein
MARKSEDSEEKRAIIREWDQWWAAKHLPTNRKAIGDDGMMFFLHLQNERQHLLDFRTKGRDPWQIIQGWLLQQRKVID